MTMPAPPPVPTAGLLVKLDARQRGGLTIERGHVLAWRSTVDGKTVLLASSPGHAPEWAPARGGGRPAVRFRGEPQALRCLGFGRKADRWTLAVVVAAADDVRGGGLVSACPAGGHDFDPGFTVDLYGSQKALGQISVEGAGRIGGQQNQLSAPRPAGGLHLIVVERDDRDIRVRVDGQPQQARPVTPATTDMHELRIGARFFAGKEREYLRGDVSAVALYDRILTQSELATLEEALKVSDEEQKQGEAEARNQAENRKKNRMVAPVVTEKWPDVKAFAASPAARELGPVDRLPVQTGLKHAMFLASQHLNSLFDADRDGEPFFYSNRRVDGTGVMFHSVNIGIPHVVGRALLGSMMAERAAGIPFPEHGLPILERYLKLTFDNEDHLNSYNDPEKENRRFVEFHNMREGLYGLVMLIEGRNSAWARETAHQMLVTLDAITDEKGEWSIELLRKRGMEERSFGVCVMNASRMVDPLLELHRATGDPLAMKLAGLYARAALRTGYDKDGQFAPMDRSTGHIHTITSSLSGITEYAILTHDAAMLDHCIRIVDKGVPGYFSSWGWGDEVMPEHPADEPSRGEMNQTGDVIRTCLLLGVTGRPKYYELAERYLRSMVLPTQHLEAEMRAYLHDAPNPKDDSERNVLARTIGGYAMQLPNDRMQVGDWPLSTLDITSGALHAMAECWRSRMTSDGTTCRLNLLFDVENEGFKVTSGLPLRGTINFSARADRVLLVRIPAWVDVATLNVAVNKKPQKVEVRDGYARIGALKAGDEGTLHFAVPCRTERERVDHVTYRTTWIGNQIVRIDPRGKVSPLPF